MKLKFRIIKSKFIAKEVNEMPKVMDFFKKHFVVVILIIVVLLMGYFLIYNRNLMSKEKTPELPKVASQEYYVKSYLKDKEDTNSYLIVAYPVEGNQSPSLYTFPLGFVTINDGLDSNGGFRQMMTIKTHIDGYKIVVIHKKK